MGNSVTSDVPKVSPSGEGPCDDELTYVFTHRDLSHATDAVEFIDRSVADLLTGFKKQHEHVCLGGGHILHRHSYANTR